MGEKKVPKGYHRTKDGRIAKKGLYYYMNKAKKSGKSKPGKGSVTDKALKDAALKKGFGINFIPHNKFPKYVAKQDALLRKAMASIK